jgi:hypothetical protein
MLTVDAAFDRITSALRKIGYTVVRDQRSADYLDSPDDRVAEFALPKLRVRVCWYDRARLLVLQVRAEEEWVNFAKRTAGPDGIEESAVEALISAVRNEVDETSTEPG